MNIRNLGSGRVQGVNAADVKGMSAAEVMQMMKGMGGRGGR